MSPEEQGLLQAIQEEPDEDFQRLIYADWLEENGNVTKAEFVRLQCELAQLDAYDPRARALGMQSTMLVREHAPRWMDGSSDFFGTWSYQRGTLEVSLPEQPQLGTKCWDWIRKNRWSITTVIAPWKRVRDVEADFDTDVLGMIPELKLRNSIGLGEDLAGLKKLPNLRSLSIHHQTDPGEWISSILRRPQLRALDVIGSSITGYALGTLNRLTELRKLRIRGVHKTCTPDLQAFSHLRELTLWGESLPGQAFAPLESLQKLETLTLINQTLSVRAFRSLRKLPNLKRLALSVQTIRETAAEEMGRLTHIHVLNLRDCYGRSPCFWLGHLAPLTHLRELHLGNRQVDDNTDLKRLRELVHLEVLGLQDSTVTSQDLKHLRSLEHLSSLNLSHSLVDDRGIRHLRELPSLRWLDVRRSKISDKGVERIRREMPLVYLVE